VEDKLFATLDTTVRRLEPDTRPSVLVSDTVGFIKKLPHDLVASFRSTLDEALEASLLVYVVDASDPTFRGQLEVTRAVMEEIGATDVPSVLLLNKRDRLAPGAGEQLLEEFAPSSPVGAPWAAVLLVSSKDRADVDRVRRLLVDTFAAGLSEANLVVPYDRASLVGEIRDQTSVLEERYEDDGIHYHLRASEGLLQRLRARLT
jgi:GTPase